MVFSSTIFLFVFLPLVIASYYLINPKYRNVLLLVASLGFYAWGEIKYTLLLVFSIMVNYLFALGIDRFRDKKIVAKVLLTFAVLFDASLLYVFKYVKFTIENVNKIFGSEFVVKSIALPIGISFFTFKAISYVVDVYQKKGKVQKNPLNVALYISFFPQLMAGPIGKYEIFEKEMSNRKESWETFSTGITRFMIGLAKKVMISNALAVVADRSFATTEFSSLSVTFAWLGAICYTLQIYFDFSGYSDMAIGLGNMFGFHFGENFNYPYVSRSISDFWKRWHISLTQWFRDYVYIPLGGSRVSKKRMYFNIFLVWMLTGFWHGASWNFIFWGLFYFILQTFEKITGMPDRFKHTWLKIVYRIFTLLCINFGWVLFRANGLKHAIHYILCMFGLQNNTLADLKSIYILKDYSVLLVIAVVACIPMGDKIRKVTEQNKMLWFYEIARAIAVVLLFVVSISYCVNGSYNPFIYFNF